MSAQTAGLPWRRTVTPLIVAGAVLLGSPLGVRLKADTTITNRGAAPGATTATNGGAAPRATTVTNGGAAPRATTVTNGGAAPRATTVTNGEPAREDTTTAVQPQAPSGQKPPATPSSPQPPSKPGTPPQAKPAAPPSRSAAAPSGPTFTFQAFGTIGYTVFAANQTFDAVLGSSGGLVYGGGVTVTHRRGYFGRVSIERFSGDGERVFVYDGEAFPLGIPLSVSMTPIDFTGGYRFLPKPKPVKPAAAPPPRRPMFQPARPRPTDQPPAPPPTPPPATASRAGAAPTRRWIPYVGGGVGFMPYKETSDFAEAGEDVSETFTTYHLLGGVDVRLSEWVGAGAEVAWRLVPNGLQDSYVGQQFGEDDLGGFTFRALITVGR